MSHSKAVPIIADRKKFESHLSPLQKRQELLIMLGMTLKKISANFKVMFLVLEQRNLIM